MQFTSCRLINKGIVYYLDVWSLSCSIIFSFLIFTTQTNPLNVDVIFAHYVIILKGILNNSIHYIVHALKILVAAQTPLAMQDVQTVHTTYTDRKKDINLRFIHYIIFIFGFIETLKLRDPYTG